MLRFGPANPTCVISLQGEVYFLLPFAEKDPDQKIGCSHHGLTTEEGFGVKALTKKIVMASIIMFFMGGPLHPLSASANASVVAPDTYEVGIPREYILSWARPKVLDRQQESNWCWAASIQMVLNLAHIPVTQDQIVKRVFGHKTDSPATPAQIMKALDGWGSMNNGKQVSVTAFIEPSYDQVLLDLSLNFPVILALKFKNSKVGHAVVVTAAQYKVVDGKKQIQYFLVWDPWPKNPIAEKLEPQLFQDIKGAIGIRIFLKDTH